MKYIIFIIKSFHSILISFFSLFVYMIYFVLYVRYTIKDFSCDQM